MAMIRWLSAATLLPVSVAPAQTLTGTVLRKEDRTPIAGASVHAIDAKTASTADRLGRFAIRLTAPDRLVVAAIGFAPDTVALNRLPAEPLVVELVAVPVVMSDLIAVAPATPPLDLSTHGRWEMPIEAARTIPAAVETDVYRALAMIPAASFTSPLSARPMIRGYDAQEVSTRIDGFEVLNLYHLGRIFSSFPADATDQVNLLVAPYTSANGGSVAGIIDITGRTGRSGDFNGGGGMSFGSFSAYAGGGNDKVRTFVTGRLLHVSSVRFIPGIDVPYHFEDVYAGAVFGPVTRPRGRLTIFGTQDRAGKDENFLDWDNLVVGSRWRVFDRGTTTLELSGSAARYRQDGVAVPGLNQRDPADLTNRFSRLASGVDLVSTSANTRLAVGLSLGWRRIRNRISPSDSLFGFARFQSADVDLSRAEFTGYGEVTQRLGPAALEAALRIDRAGPLTSAQPRLHGRLTVSRRLELSAGVGRTSRLYHLLSDARSEPDFDFLDFWMNAGDGVPRVNVDHATVDVNLDFSPVVARLSAYLSKGDGIGELRPEHDSRPRPMAFFRFGKSRTRGIEAQIAYRGDERHRRSLSLSYAMSRSERNWGNGWIRWAQDRRHQVRLLGQAFVGKFNLFALIDGATGMPATAPGGQVFRDIPGFTDDLNNSATPFQRFGAENAVGTSGTIRTDVGLNVVLGTPGKTRTTLGVGIINLLQSQVAPISGQRGAGAYAQTKDGAPTPFRRLFSLPGFPTLTLRFEF